MTVKNISRLSGIKIEKRERKGRELKKQLILARTAQILTTLMAVGVGNTENRHPRRPRRKSRFSNGEWPTRPEPRPPAPVIWGSPMLQFPNTGEVKTTIGKGCRNGGRTIQPGLRQRAPKRQVYRGRQCQNIGHKMLRCCDAGDVPVCGLIVYIPPLDLSLIRQIYLPIKVNLHIFVAWV